MRWSARDTAGPQRIWVVGDPHHDQNKSWREGNAELPGCRADLANPLSPSARLGDVYEVKLSWFAGAGLAARHLE